MPDSVVEEWISVERLEAKEKITAKAQQEYKRQWENVSKERLEIDVVVEP